MHVVALLNDSLFFSSCLIIVEKYYRPSKALICLSLYLRRCFLHDPKVLSITQRHFFFFFFMRLLGLQDLSSPTRDRTHVPLGWLSRILTTGPLGNSHVICWRDEFWPPQQCLIPYIVMFVPWKAWSLRPASSWWCSSHLLLYHMQNNNHSLLKCFLMIKPRTYSSVLELDSGGRGKVPGGWWTKIN